MRRRALLRFSLFVSSLPFIFLAGPTRASTDTATHSAMLSGAPASRASAVSDPDVGSGDGRVLLTFQALPRSEFGNAVANGGDLNADGDADLVVGAWAGGSASDWAASEGSVYVFYGGRFGDAVPDAVLYGTFSGDGFGSSVAAAGDVDGNGHEDLIVGARHAGLQGRGLAYLCLGGYSLDFPRLALRPTLSDAGFGASVTSAGDLNGDGYSDVIVGAPGQEGDGQNPGHAYVYFGGSLRSTPDLILAGSGVNDHFGAAVGSAGDFNGDGFPDFVVGEPFLGTGRAYLYHGGPGLDAVADRVLTGEAVGDGFGTALAPVGDVDGDGYDDLLVSAPFHDANGQDAGRAYLYFGGPGGRDPMVFTGERSLDGFGRSVASAGDMNTDGHADLIVGAPRAGSGDMNTGRAYVYFGGPVLDETPDLVLEGEAPEDRFGISVAAIGDFNDDGGADVVVGASLNDLAGSQGGRAYLLTARSHPPAVRAPSAVAAGTRQPLQISVSAVDAEGDPITSLTAAPLPPGATFTSGGFNRSGLLQWTPTDLQIGVYDVTFTASNFESGSTTTRITVSFVNHPPALNPSEGMTVREGATADQVLTGFDLDGDPLEFQLIGAPSFASVSAVDASSASLHLAPGYGDAGTYTAAIRIDDAHGGIATADITIIVEDVNRGPVAVTGGPYVGVINVPIAFDGSGSSDPDGTALTYQWDFGDLTSGTGAAPSHAYSAGGAFTVSLTVSDGGLTGEAATDATVQDVFPARAFVSQSHRTIRLGAGRPTWCVEIEPVGSSLLLSSVIPSTIVLRYGAGQIPAQSDRVSVGDDRDANGITEMTACFSKTDLRALFAELPNGTSAAVVTVEGGLSTGGKLQGALTVDVVSSAGSLAASVSPNPMNPSAVLTFTTSRPGRVRVTLFDLRGRLVRTLLPARDLAAGYHDLQVDGRNERGQPLTSGAYFYRIDAPEGVQTGRLVILK